MLKAILAIATALLLAACEGEVPRPPAPPPPPSPLALEANYRLTYNDTLVGNALFVVEIDAAGDYRVDAFTVPAGQMQRDAAHEVLESSQGHISGAQVRPTHFEQSVLQGDELAVASLAFDWDERRLVAQGPEGRREVVLVPGTQDRLSYLLVARQLAAAGEGSSLLQVASLDASEETRLVVDGRAAVEVPHGRYEAVVVRRLTTDSDETRRLWFAPQHSPLPLRVLQERDGNSVDMQLQTLSRSSSGPR